MIKTAMLLADGFEEIEALAVVDILRRAGISCDLAALTGNKVSGCHQISVEADCSIDDLDESYQMIILPGGLPGATNLRDDERVIHLVKNFDADKEKFVAAICAAPMVLAKAEITKGRHLTSYPGFENLFTDAFYEQDLVVVDGHLITARGPAAAMPFGYALAQLLNADSEKLEQDMLFSLLKEQYC